MAVTIAGSVHSTPIDSEGRTRCGLTYDPADYFKSGDVTCKMCNVLSARAFIDGWGTFQAEHTPEELRAMDEEA